MNGQGWTTVRVHTTARPAVIAALFHAGAEAVEETDSALVTHFRRLTSGALDSAIHAADGGARVEYAATPDVDWSAEWRARIGAHRVGRIVVTPPWLAERFAPDDRVVIEPAMAFGTGEHESTRGVLQLMQDVVAQGDVVADLGAGSAVLSIAAAKLGAARVIAIEVDPDAIGNAEDNVARNGVADRVTVLEGDAATLLPLVAPIRVVFANIISSVIVQLLPTIRDALSDRGAGILAGVLVEEHDDIEREIARSGFRVERSLSDGLWWSATIIRR